MKREITVRAWYKKQNIMLDGTAFHVDAGDGTVCQCFEGGYGCSGSIDRLDCVVMQYIGLKDKNGFYIFEGDIVKTPVSLSVVEFDNGMFGLNHDYGTDRKSMLGSWGNETNLRTLSDGYNRCIEVIGNIYENPKILNH